MEEQSPAPESCKDEEKMRKKGNKEGGREEGRISSTSTLENLEIIDLDQLEKVDRNT